MHHCLSNVCFMFSIAYILTSFNLIKYNFNIHSIDNSLLILLTANCLIHLRNNQSFAAARFLSALNKIKSHTFDFRNTNLLTFSIGK